MLVRKAAVHIRFLKNMETPAGKSRRGFLLLPGLKLIYLCWMNFLQIRYTILLLLLLTGTALKGQLRTEAPRFSYLDREDGLADNNVQAILQDPDGFMWFGTRNGLCRYDGYDMRIYRHTKGPNSIAGNRILSLAMDHQGYLWIGTYANGLSRYDREKNEFRNYGLDQGIGNWVSRVTLLSDSSLWVCSNQGLARYIPGKDSFDVFLHQGEDAGSVPPGLVYDILRTRDGKIYVATDSDAIQELDLQQRSFRAIPYSRDPSLGSNYLKRILEGPDGLLYILGHQHGLAILDPTDGHSQLITAGEQGLSTNLLSGGQSFDSQGRLWICTDGGGMNIYDPVTSSFSYLKEDEGDPTSLLSDHLYSVFFDDENRAWIGSFDKGICIHDSRHFKFGASLFESNDLRILRSKSVLALFEDGRGRIWVGTDGDGLYCFEKGRPYRVYRHDPADPNSLSTDVITSLGEDGRGNILIGTYAGGLNSLDPERVSFTRFMPSAWEEGGISSTSVWKIHRDSKERVWLGLLAEGLDRYYPETSTFEPYGPGSQQANRIDFPNLMEITEDSEGDIWFGTEGNGIYILDRQTGRMQHMDQDILGLRTAQSSVSSIYQDRSGIYWIATEGDGLVRYNKSKRELDVFGESGELPGNIIQSLNEDRHFNLWIGTNNGIARMNRSNNTVISFNTADGLSGNEFNRGSLIRLADGRLLAGTRRGADILSPDLIALNQTLPRVEFTSLSILNSEVEAGDTVNGRVVLEKEISFMDKLELKYSDKSFSIGFAALNYTLPEKCSFRYRLEGFDEQWIGASADNRLAKYSNLDPGNYVLRVEASNNDGKWGVNTQSMHIQISAPFYMTTWFILIVVLSGLLLFMILYRIRFLAQRNMFLQRQNQQERRIMELENDKLESELQTLSLKRIHRNRILLAQKKKLLGLAIKAQESVKTGLDEIIGELDNELLEDKDWKYIEPQLDKVYNNFITKLKERHGDLSQSEIKLAAYVRMGLSTKEISEFMHKTIRGIESDRYRLRKKMGLEQSDSLSSYLLNI